MLHGLKQGNEVLREIHKEMNLESVEKLLEESQEAREYQRVRCVVSRRPRRGSHRLLLVALAGNRRDAR